MTSSDRRTLRELLLRYIATQYETADLDNDQFGQMRSLFDRWRSLPGEANDDARYDVEGEIILRWMEWRQP